MDYNINLLLLYIIPLVLDYLIEYKIAGSTRHNSIVSFIPILNIIWFLALIKLIIGIKKKEEYGNKV